MHIIHPQGMFRGLPPEDVFIAIDDMGSELGYGYVFYQFQPHRYPNCPLNLYFLLECQPVARYLLFGALAARARQLRDLQPGIPARLYTNISPTDTRMRDFYTHNGFHMNNVENLLLLEMPASGSRIPMSLSLQNTSLQTLEEQQALVARMLQNDVSFVSIGALQEMMCKPHFLALSLYRNEYLVGEILANGQGDACEVYAVYVEASNRGQGMGTFLVHRAMEHLAAKGVVHFTTHVISHSEPSCRLMGRFNATVQGVCMLYPYMPL